MSEQRDALAARVMAALNEHGRSYRLPRDPSDLAYSVADAILATEGDAAPGETAEQMRLRAEAAEGATLKLVTALGTHFLTDGSPCFCSRWDAIYGNGDVVHQPRCRMGRIALGYSGEPRTVGCAASDSECKGRRTGGVPHDVAPIAARAALQENPDAREG